MAVFGAWRNPLRWILVFGFLLFCPGMTFAFLLPNKDQLTRFVLIIVLSLSLDTAIVQVFLYAGKWSPNLILVALIAFCWLGVLLEILAPALRRTSAQKL